MVSEGTEVTQGTDLSAIYIVDNNLAPVMSYSYGQCKLFLGSSGNAFYKALWQQAAAQGISVLIASGDSGAAGCDTADGTEASYGLGVNGLGSTPYNISVGGTDFYLPQGGAAFWNSINSSSTQASAKGYIPEAPWNESCTNTVFATSRVFAGQTAEQICNSGVAFADGLLSVVGGGGGASSCTQSNGSSASSCKGNYSKPSWQVGGGLPSDGVRDIPDVSLFAGAGFFGAFYVVCQQSTNTDGRPCNLAAPTYDFAGYGGTSVAAPAFAGILSLINQKTGSRQGNANYVLYNLASQQQKAGTTCSAISGAPAPGCVFNDMTTDTIAMPCLNGSPSCTVTNSADRYGVLSGYNSGAGYDLTTGLGSVNAANLVNNWTNANFTASSTALTLSPSTILHGSAVSAVVNVTSTTGTPTGNISINALAQTARFRQESSKMAATTHRSAVFREVLTQFRHTTVAMESTRQVIPMHSHSPLAPRPARRACSLCSTIQPMVPSPQYSLAPRTPMEDSFLSVQTSQVFPDREWPPATSCLPPQVSLWMAAHFDSTPHRTPRIGYAR